MFPATVWQSTSVRTQRPSAGTQASSAPSSRTRSEYEYGKEWASRHCRGARADPVQIARGSRGLRGGARGGQEGRHLVALVLKLHRKLTHRSVSD